MGSVASTLKRIAVVTMPLAALAGGIVSACGAGHPALSSGADPDPGAGSCATPQMGCPCTPGSVVTCGKTVNTTNDFRFCYEGKRTCTPAGVYGDCEDGNIVSHSLSTGIHALGLGSPAPCTNPITTQPLMVCTDGKHKGDECTTNLDCGGGKKKCSGGTDSHKDCKKNSECQVLCTQFLGKCSGGTNNDFGCNVATDCPGGTCHPEGGGNCALFVGICNNGTNDGNECNLPTDCPSGTCEQGHGKCFGGKDNGAKCKHDKHCAGGAGVCSAEAPDAGTAIDPCDPYCNAIADSPVGIDAGPGMTVIDGGLTIDPGAAATVIGVWQSAAGGKEACDTNNKSGTTCTYGGAINQCGQDFHCDAITSTCLWNGGPGYKDTTCAGVDLQSARRAGLAAPPPRSRSAIEAPSPSRRARRSRCTNRPPRPIRAPVSVRRPARTT